MTAGLCLRPGAARLHVAARYASRETRPALGPSNNAQALLEPRASQPATQRTRCVRCQHLAKVYGAAHPRARAAAPEARYSSQVTAAKPVSVIATV